MLSIKEQSGWRFTTSICSNYRGTCSFDDKIRSAQSAGFKAATIYDSVDGAPLIETGGTQQAVFISKASGKLLKKHAGRTEVELWILPTFENYPWSIMAVSFISLLAMSAVLATCFFVCKHHVRRERPRGPPVPELHGMSRHDIHNCFGRQLYFKSMCYLSGRL